MRVIQPSTRSTLGEYDIRPPLARYVWHVTWNLAVLRPTYAHVHLGLSTLDVTHVRKCTRLSLLYRTASNEKLGVGLGTRLGEAVFHANVFGRINVSNKLRYKL